MAERVVAGFGEDLNDEKFPIVCVCAKPLIQKFADELTHRDFLGALMNLGIKRELVGDIIVDDSKYCPKCMEKAKILKQLNNSFENKNDEIKPKMHFINKNSGRKR